MGNYKFGFVKKRFFFIIHTARNTHVLTLSIMPMVPVILSLASMWVARVYPNSLVLMLVLCCKSSNVHTFLIVHAVLERYTHFFIIFHKVLLINVHVLFEKVEQFSDF